MSDAKSSEEIAFEEMARLIQEKESAGVEMQVFIRKLEEEAAQAARRVEVARIVADICVATKTRKPRSDKGKKRNKVSETTHERADLLPTPGGAAGRPDSAETIRDRMESGSLQDGA